MAELAEQVKEPAFKPYISPAEKPYELTFRSLFFGGIFGILFGAVTVYVGLRAGLTVAASIPIAVLSISILRAVGRLLPPFGAAPFSKTISCRPPARRASPSPAASSSLCPR